jgi:hypothetical protein
MAARLRYEDGKPRGALACQGLTAHAIQVRPRGRHPWRMRNEDGKLTLLSADANLRHAPGLPRAGWNAPKFKPHTAQLVCHGAVAYRHVTQIGIGANSCRLQPTS